MNKTLRFERYFSQIERFAMQWLYWKCIDWFLYDRDLQYERVKRESGTFLFIYAFQLFQNSILLKPDD